MTFQANPQFAGGRVVHKISVKGFRRDKGFRDFLDLYLWLEEFADRFGKWSLTISFIE